MHEPDDDSRSPGPTAGPLPPDPEESRAAAATGPDGPSDQTSPFRRHPVRWTVAAGGVALVLALGGYGVTQAATSTSTSTTATAGATGTGRPPGTAVSGNPGSSGPPPEGSPGGPPGGAAARGGKGGKVTAISGDTIVLTTMAGKAITVSVTSTTVFKDGTTTSTQSALKKGDIAVVTGSTSSDGTVTATTITFGSAPSGAPGTHTPPTGA